MIIGRLFGRAARRERGDKLYAAIVAQARSESFYRDCGVPDTVDGRFDLIVLHTYIVLDRLRAEGEAGRKLSQQLFDTLFDDMDRSLREMGVGDLSVGKHVKRMASGFYGRMKAYDEARAGRRRGPGRGIAAQCLWRPRRAGGRGRR